jgi:hypothetical protein
VFFLVAGVLPRPGARALMLALLIAILVEAFRLVHAPWLDAFRLTLPGALPLGRVFSLWNILAYGATCRGEERAREPKELTGIEKQKDMSLPAMLADLPWCRDPFKIGACKALFEWVRRCTI